MRWNPAESIIIEITPSQVTFFDPGGAPMVLAPVIYLPVGAERIKILAVGSAPNGQVALQVEVLGPDRPPDGISKFDCLVAFFTHGLKAILDRSLFRLRPEVLVRGADSVSQVFGGYERDLITSALERAGAKRVRWPEDAQAS